MINGARLPDGLALPAERSEQIVQFPTGFAANTLMWADQIRSGNVVRWPFGDASAFR